ncbi:membrane protein insertase YidC [Reichenbachiella sp. MALMAid0571]|uniref:membrane protein insertase YidC n=1 Tax=Reichenbachiella sp. MALMAid0571 TaxID=3143939 RepID=UPI0032DF0165
MDRNQIIGLVLMLVLMTVYFQFFSPEIPEPVAEQTTTEQTSSNTQSQSMNNAGSTAILQQEDDSLLAAMNNEKYGVFAGYASGSEKTFEIENEDFVATFSSKGGQIKSLVLKKHLTFEKKPLVLIDENSSDLDIWIKSNYRSINISELYFSTNGKSGKVSATDTLRFSYRMNLEGNRYIEQQYAIPGTGYVIGYNLKMSGLDGIVDNEDIQLNWVDKMKVYEDNLKDSRAKSTINYKPTGQDMDYLSPTSTDKETEEINAPLNWLAFHQKFFTSAIIAKNNFRAATVTTEINELDSSVVKTATMNLTIPIGDVKAGDGKFQFYFGPNNYITMKKVTDGFAENVDLGWKMFRFVNKILIIPIFHFLEKYISNYGIIIILMVIFIRILLSPLTYKSHMSMAKMKVLKPELDAIKEKHGDDAQKAQQEQMQLYSKVGINPLSGCIPMLLQFPILLAMFNFFPNSIELRQKAFLWAHDLSTYDSIFEWSTQIPLLSQFYGNHISLFTLLMTASTILYTWSNSQMQAQMQGPMKTMQYMMPVMFLFFLNSYSAGLTFYYFVSNIVSFGQIAMFRKFIDENKILKKLEENRKKNANKKKSTFQQKLEDAMKNSDQARKKKKK